MAIKFTVKNFKLPVLKREQLASACACQDNQRGRKESRRKHSGFNQPDATLIVLQNWAGVKRSKCRRHKPAVLVSLKFKDFFERQQENPRNTSFERGVDIEY